ncbi:YhaN family protein [Pseudogemmobacter faecipullorum]|uniref:AAA family ATPase n=1 Tax=Pseudogemmobacter faecipullorum TaxID=2755041 RepID=A0ABS8CSC6_9RHOB|nr:YhaN family protein [Pseudogemmobacter faecipullorum]MCB5412050.1 AAA family ATPase [Pseudogemmobacter faecipullorum]
MRLNRLDLTRYGRFTDQSLSFPPPAPGAADLHIVFGPNEAGKSTLFSAWLDLLFGIPLRTRYDFRHPGPSLTIGADLSHAGGRLEVKRLKRSSASLLDRYDAPLPEAVLQSALGGLTREGYSAMFSLDDDTLEKGGDSILASRGDLGEMLFSASAGLARLTPELEKLRLGLDSFHRSGKRSGWLYDAKKQLTGLDRQRRALEVSASALKKLTQDEQAAALDWRRAREAETALQARLEELQSLAASLPLRARREALEAQLAPLAHLPGAGPAQQRLFERSDRERYLLEERIRDRAGRLEGLEAQRRQHSPDPAALAAAGAIAEAEALRSDYDGALRDIPRRREVLNAALTRRAALLAQLGQTTADEAELRLSSPQKARLRAALSARSGLETALVNATGETARAARLFERERALPGDRAEPGDDAMLAQLLARLRARDPAENLARAERERDLARGALSRALAALAPWQGDSARLAARTPPAPWAISAWETEIENARREETDARREIAALTEELQQPASPQEAGPHEPPPSPREFARARARREALWAAHLAELSLQSASAYELALREDDRLATRLAETLAETRKAALAVTARQKLTSRLQSAEEQAMAAASRSAELLAEIAAMAAELGLAGAGLAEVRSWLPLRSTALAAAASLAEAEAALQSAKAGRAEAAQALAGALHLPDADADYDTLFARASARLQQAETRQAARLRLQALSQDLDERRASEQVAQARLAEWRSSWQAAAAGTLLARYEDHDAQLGQVLDLLEAWGSEDMIVSEQLDRIGKMEANRQRFSEAWDRVLLHFDGAETLSWDQALARLSDAREAARVLAGLTRQIETGQREAAADQLALAGIQTALRTLGESLDWQGAPGDLAAHLQECCTAAILRREIEDLSKSIESQCDHPSATDAVQLRSDISGLKSELEMLRSETEAAQARHHEARRRIEAVGGDEALALLEESRATLLMEMREKAEAHLRGRFGLIAFEAGLHRYREQHRSAMLARASEAFSRLSHGAYSGLAAQPDAAQDVLVALAASGGAKLAADLSKGTRFQLYLALRIAGYHELAQSRPTVPFIADDIMETFDDQRSEAAFALLGEMSKTGQVIYLTHHRHLCDIALQACPEAKLLDLSAL